MKTLKQECEMINKEIEGELDKQFPKGDPARGRALVLVAIAQIEIDLRDKEIRRLRKAKNKMRRR